MTPEVRKGLGTGGSRGPRYGPERTVACKGGGTPRKGSSGTEPSGSLRTQKVQQHPWLRPR